MLEQIKRSNIANYSIYLRENLLFGAILAPIAPSSIHALANRLPNF